MKLIFDLNSYVKNKGLIDDFEQIYNAGFPDVNEREDLSVIIKRVTNKKKELEPYTIILISSIDSVVVGGLIADWYDKSKSIHLTYLIIDEKFRKQGLGKELIIKGIKLIKDSIRKEGGIEIKNVFFESNNPEQTKRENDSFDPYTRLKIFSSLGAKWIDIPYVQPALDIKKKSVDNLMLLSFSQFNNNINTIPVNDIMAFLEDLYAGLGVKDLIHNKDLQNIKSKLKRSKDDFGNIELKKISYGRKSDL